MGKYRIKSLIEYPIGSDTEDESLEDFCGITDEQWDAMSDKKKEKFLIDTWCKFSQDFISGSSWVEREPAE